MPATGSISVQQLLGYPYIAGRISRIAETAGVLSDAYGCGITTVGKGRSARVVTQGALLSPKRSIVYDVFDNARTLVPMRAPLTGPSRRKRKPIGTVTVHGVRLYNSWPFTYDELRDFRVAGQSNPAMIDTRAASYINMQVDVGLQQHKNTRDFVFSRMLKGSMGLKAVGDDWWPVVPNAGGTNYDVLVDWQMPASHKGQLALLPDSADVGADPDPIITASWAASDTDIVTQLHTLRNVAAIETGLVPTEIWINSVLWGKLKNNTKLQAVGGSAFKVFDTYTRADISSSSVAQSAMDVPSPRYTYQLRALPEFNFHVYDGVYIASATGGEVDDTTDPTSANVVKLINDDEAIITPPRQQRSWFSVYDILEVVQEQYSSGLQDAYGFQAWMRNEMKPIPSVELHVLENYAYALNIPKAVYNPTVVF